MWLYSHIPHIVYSISEVYYKYIEMKHDKHELTYKKFIKAEKRLNEVYKEIREQPYTKLKEPYQSGWTLTPVLRDDFMRSDKGPIVKLLLDKLATKWTTNNPKYISQIRKKPALSDVRSILIGKHGYRMDGPFVRQITIKEYEALSEQHKKYFDLLSETFYSKYYNQREYVLNIPIHYIVVKVTKRIVTHIQDINPLLLKEQAELRKILAPYWRQHGYNDGDYHYFERRKERRKSKIELTKIDLEQ